MKRALASFPWSSCFGWVVGKALVWCVLRRPCQKKLGQRRIHQKRPFTTTHPRPKDQGERNQSMPHPSSISNRQGTRAGTTNREAPRKHIETPFTAPYDFKPEKFQSRAPRLHKGSTRTPVQDRGKKCQTETPSTNARKPKPAPTPMSSSSRGRYKCRCQNPFLARGYISLSISCVCFE